METMVRKRDWMTVAEEVHCAIYADTRLMQFTHSLKVKEKKYANFECMAYFSLKMRVGCRKYHNTEIEK